MRQSKTKMYSILKIFEVEGVAVKVEEMVTVVEVVVKKGIMRRMDNQANKIGVEEDAVVGETADQIIPTSSATNVTNMVTIRRIATLISDKCYNCGNVGHFAKVCRVDKKMEETTNLAT
jgi:Zinc knuckle